MLHARGAIFFHVPSGTQRDHSGKDIFIRRILFVRWLLDRGRSIRSETVDNTSLHRGPEGRGPHVSSCKHLQGQRGSRVFKLVPAQLSCAQHARKTVLGSGVSEIGLTKNRERNWRATRLESSGFSSHTRMRSIHFGTGIKIKFLVK